MWRVVPKGTSLAGREAGQAEHWWLSGPTPHLIAISVTITTTKNPEETSTILVTLDLSNSLEFHLQV